MEEKLIKAIIGPLVFIEVDEPWASVHNMKVTLEKILNYLCPTTSSDINTLIKRYREISVEKRLNAVPSEDRILEKLIWPLRHAKAAYMLGNYLGTISLCGMVAEMITILLFDISEIKLNAGNLDKEKQTLLFGSRYEKLGQDKRIKVLKAFGLISEDIEIKLDIIRKTRSKYLHLWSQDHDTLPKDSIEVFTSTAFIVAETIGQDTVDGCFKLNPGILKYLEGEDKNVELNNDE